MTTRGLKGREKQELSVDLLHKKFVRRKKRKVFVENWQVIVKRADERHSEADAAAGMAGDSSKTP